MGKFRISEKQERTINEFKKTLAGFSEEALSEVIKGNYEIEETFEVGDWVAFIKLLGDHIISKVENVSREKVNTDHVASNGYKQSFDKENIRHATPEEIKAEQERRLWKSIGRDVRAFEIGDIYVDINNNCREIYNGKSVSEARRVYDGGRIKGFYPAESFVSFGGDSND